MVNEKEFEIVDVLSLSTHTVFECRGSKGLEDVIEHMTDLSPKEYAALTPEAKRELIRICTDAIKQMHTVLTKIKAPPIFAGIGDREWLRDTIKTHQLGKRLAVPKILKMQ